MEASKLAKKISNNTQLLEEVTRGNLTDHDQIDLHLSFPYREW